MHGARQLCSYTFLDTFSVLYHLKLWMFESTVRLTTRQEGLEALRMMGSFISKGRELVARLA